MKKSLIALAVMAAAGAASAPSQSVTLFGIVDTTVQRVLQQHQPGVQGPPDQLWLATSFASGLPWRGNSGWRHVCLLLAGSRYLETNDDGRGAATNTNNQGTGGAVAGIGGGQGLTFNRRSTVSLAGGFGEVRWAVTTPRNSGT